MGNGLKRLLEFRGVRRDVRVTGALLLYGRHHGERFAKVRDDDPFAFSGSSDELGEVRLGLSNADRLHACSPESRPDRVRPYARIGKCDHMLPSAAALRRAM